LVHRHILSSCRVIALTERKPVDVTARIEELTVTSGIRTVIYPVKDLVQAKTLFGKLSGVEPVMDEAYYVQFNVGDQEIGLDPRGHSKGMTGPVGYWHVDDVQESLKQLLDAGAEVQQAVSDVGGGRQIASVKDADGNVIGLVTRRHS
jgi:predicted enzyme related to lactoylglutathione lyase